MTKQRYYIVPKEGIVAESVTESPEEAIINFATIMDTDMNTYFKAVPANEYDKTNSKSE